MLRLTRSQLQAIEDHGASAYPDEGCGLLLGRHENGFNIVAGIFPTENAWAVPEERPVRFLIPPVAMVQAELAAAAQGMDVIGVFHSHPDHEPVASARDLAWATWPGYSYLITAVRAGRPAESRSWQLEADRSGFREEPVIVGPA